VPNITAAEEARLRNLLIDNVDIEVRTRLHVSSVLNRLDRPRDAIEHLDRIIELEPDLAEAYSRRAQILQELGEYEQAVNSVNRFLALSTHPFEHPSIRRAYELRTECEFALAQAEQQQ